MNKTILIVVIVAALVIGGYFLLNSGNQPEVSGTPSTSPTLSNTATVSPSAASSPAGSPSKSPSAQVKTFNISGENYSFSLSEMRVKKGDTVKVVFTNKEGMHDWVIDEFSARTPKIQAGQTATVTFVADKVGTFEYYCSVGSHRLNGMKGNLVVE